MSEESTALMVIDDRKVLSAVKAQDAITLIQTTKQSALDLAEKYAFLVIETDEDLVQAEKALLEVKKFQKTGETEKKGWGEPLYTVKSAFDRFMRESLEPAATLENALNSIIQSYRRKKEQERIDKAAEDRKRAEAAQRRAEKAGKPLSIPEPSLASPPAVKLPKAEGISYVRYWKYNIIDESLIPDAFKMTVPNEAAIDAAVQGGKYIPAGEDMTQNRTKIPGVNIYYEDKPRPTGRR